MKRELLENVLFKLRLEVSLLLFLLLVSSAHEN